MNQLTLRGFDRDLERELRRIAKEEGVSLNQAALRLLRKGAGLSNRGTRPIGNALDAFVGCITDEDAKDIEAAVHRDDEIDLAAQKRARTRGH
jgi:DNA polymerase III gamma/tau subunit